MKLNLCCGANIFPGWINIDKVDMEPAYLRHLREAPDGFVWPEPQRELAAWVKAGKPLHVIQWDVRKGLACVPYLAHHDNEVDAIYIGQAIEHFNRRTEAPALLRECLRVLKRGGAIRLTTPDLWQLTNALNHDLDNEGCVDHDHEGLGQFRNEQPDFYATALPEDQVAYLLFGASGEGSTNENYEGHHHCYTSRSLARLLMECGFNTEEKTMGRIGGHHLASAPFHDTRDFGMSHSFAIEAVKP